MRSVISCIVAFSLWSVPLTVAGQEGQAAGMEEAHQQTILVKPSEQGCAVVLHTKVGKALGTPEGLATATHGETGKKPLPSLISCQCGPKVESKECAQGGTCACGPSGDTPSVVCN